MFGNSVCFPKVHFLNLHNLYSAYLIVDNLSFYGTKKSRKRIYIFSLNICRVHNAIIKYICKSIHVYKSNITLSNIVK